MPTSPITTTLTSSSTASGTIVRISWMRPDSTIPR
jgi:hypothetical protein